jgi:hypothetical protein
LKDSVLLQTGKRHSELNLVSTNSLYEPICVVDNIGCPHNSVIVVQPRRDWAKEFC